MIIISQQTESRFIRKHNLIPLLIPLYSLHYFSQPLCWEMRSINLIRYENRSNKQTLRWIVFIVIDFSEKDISYWYWYDALLGQRVLAADFHTHLFFSPLPLLCYWSSLYVVQRLIMINTFLSTHLIIFWLFSKEKNQSYILIIHYLLKTSDGNYFFFF